MGSFNQRMRFETRRKEFQLIAQFKCGNSSIFFELSVDFLKYCQSKVQRISRLNKINQLLGCYQFSFSLKVKIEKVSLKFRWNHPLLRIPSIAIHPTLDAITIRNTSWAALISQVHP